MKANVSLKEEIAEIRLGIERYQCDEAGREILNRITGSERVLEAIAELELDDNQRNRLTLSLIEAVINKENFEERLSREKKFLDEVTELHRAVSRLMKFIREATTDEPWDQLSAQIVTQPEDQAGYLETLREIDGIIGSRTRIAQETKARIGATRNSSLPVAGENAGIGWLAASIEGITGQPHIRQACAIAEILFDINEVTEDRLIGALRNFPRGNRPLQLK